MFLVFEIFVMAALLGGCFVCRRLYGVKSLLFVSSLLISLYWMWFFGPVTNIIGALSPQLVENPSTGSNWNIYPPLFAKSAILIGSASVVAVLLLIVLPLTSARFKHFVSISLPLGRVIHSLSLKIYAWLGTGLLTLIVFRFGPVIGTQYFDFSGLRAVDKALISSYFLVPAGPAIALGILGVLSKRRTHLLVIAAGCFVNILCFVVLRQRLYCLISSVSLAVSLCSAIWLGKHLNLSRLIISASLSFLLLLIGYSAPTILKGQFGETGFSPKADQIERHLFSLHHRFALDFSYRLSGVGSASSALHARSQILNHKCLNSSDISLLRGPLVAEFLGSLPLGSRRALGYEPSRLPEYLIGQCYGRDQVDLVETQALPFLLQFNVPVATFFFAVWLSLSRLAIVVSLWVALRVFSIDASGFLLIPLLYLSVITGGLGEFMTFVKVLPVFLALYALPSSVFRQLRLAR